MKAFEKWLEEILIKVAPKLTKHNRSFIYCWTKRFKNASEKGWREALKWYKDIADKCENDCVTDKDFRTLYFHLKQILENEIEN